MTSSSAKVRLIEDKMTNSIELQITDEDHTLGNALTAELQAIPGVVFAAYKIPHPLQNILKLKVSLSETAEDRPLELVKQALSNLVAQCDSLEASLSLHQQAWN
ncbi:DNA-directed RNA polymerase II subunit RPB11 [Nematocida homosporus]|uniref:DNA-directed RNA polymerase II subunit RPB11 n=1 Tax=Nematocida homosporus TaxID=1912981 RepID=UPI002220CA46|nr:DNA-directed RNA polymerase II subunit RPB11 [Nematocida homosporus]KAI5185285.1 DNA-directed RNA polymerase II subunit RPB11 [Nematocida homosporus]